MLRPISICAAFVLLAAATARAEPACDTYRSSTSARDAVQAEPAASERVAFRLGDAARPFGWSTVIGDFDTDGKPDVAVADHIGRRAGIYAYRIELAMSSQAADGVTFESAHDAITISVSDVDRDRDLDIIVRLPLSGETIGVWLNDGHGHFTSADLPTFPGALQPRQTIDGADASIDFTPFESSRRRSGDGIPTAVRVTPSISRLCSLFTRSRSLQSPFASLRATPRAPPTRFHDSLS
jgi:VCBS repeat protein